MEYLIKELNGDIISSIQRIPFTHNLAFVTPTIETFDILNLHAFVSDGISTPDTLYSTRKVNGDMS